MVSPLISRASGLQRSRAEEYNDAQHRLHTSPLGKRKRLRPVPSYVQVGREGVVASCWQKISSPDGPPPCQAGILSSTVFFKRRTLCTSSASPPLPLGEGTASVKTHVVIRPGKGKITMWW